MFRLRLIDRLKYMMERMLDGGPFGQLLLVGAVVAFVALGGGVLAFWFAPAGVLAEEVWWSFLRLTDPGYLGDDEGLWRRGISTLLTVLGYVLFMGTLVAIMTQWLFRQMRHLEQGHTPITFKSHRVILGWTSRTLPVLRELLEHGKSRGPESRIAVLADDITEGPVSEVLNERWSHSERRRVVLRSGSTLNPEHLHRVAIEQANCILIPRRSNTSESVLNADADIIKMLLSLDTQTAYLKQRPFVVAELLDANKIPVALHTYKGPLQIIPSDTVIARIIARSVIYSGLLRALNALLIDVEQPLLIPHHYPGLTGKSWREVFNYFDQATPCGVIQVQGGQRKTMLAPPLDYVLTEHDLVVILAHRNDKQQPLNQPQKMLSLQEPAKLIQKAHASRHRLLVLGWNSRVPKVLDELAREKNVYFDVTLVSTAPVADREQALTEQLGENWPGVTKCLQADYTNETVQQGLHPEMFHTVLLFSSDRVGTGEEADARSIVAFMVLDYLLSKLAKGRVRPHVLLELHDQSNEVYVSHSNNDVMVSSVIISHILAQVALHPYLRSVYDDLLSSHGAHLSIRFLPEGLHRELAIAEVQQYVLAEGGVLLGVNPTGKHVELNVRANKRFTFGPQSQLIVIR
ncbi:CASTOR/POLLUX-related putative ion channel [Aliidiomarina quisquiliarum]|uniref:CASTOR/POLLUX-related putative ion channel n=1 Tax=Aliidiomarina quisquiliarum TaxID=2938947 RepID=UPI00208F3453|nr:hypothetical protein [Aliidiomarina quisquiliarum]MCO4320550.1 hypothetical protein [Aliidiomarina quisquiliarum]